MSVPAPTLAQVYSDSYAKFGGRPAVRDADRELTFAQLGTRARKVANALRGLGLAPGARCVVLAPNSCQWVEADQGMAIGDYVRVGLLPRLHAAEVAQIATDIEPEIVLVDSEWIGENGLEWLPDEVRHRFALGTAEPPPGWARFEELVESGADQELPEPDPDSICWVMYTSGSTGLPKGVLSHQRGIGAMIRNTLNEMPQLDAEQVALHTAPISHFSGSIGEAVSAVGGLNVLEPSFEVARVIEVVEAGEVTVLPLVPTQITILVEELGRRGEPRGRIGNVKLVAYAGSAIQPDRAARAREYFGDGVMQQVYGASETPLPIASLHPADHVGDLNRRGLPRLASAGKPTHYVDVKIIDEEGKVLEDGEIGEIKVGGEQVSPGYWRQPEATAETFKDGYVHTGDIGYIDEDGYLFILDRRKDMIVTGGFNVYPREVENAISTLAGVREVAVVGSPDDRWGELITAVISLEDGAELSAEEVIDHCRDSIGGYKVPKRVDFVAELPKSGVGKIQKTVLRDQLWAGRARRV